jgi:hypothetical protein
VEQAQLAAVADAEAIADLVDRHGSQGCDHRLLGLLLAASQDRFLGLDRFELGVGVGQAEACQSLRVGFAGDAVEQGRVAGLDPLGGLGDSGGDPVTPVGFLGHGQTGHDAPPRVSRLLVEIEAVTSDFTLPQRP